MRVCGVPCDFLSGVCLPNPGIETLSVIQRIVESSSLPTFLMRIMVRAVPLATTLREICCVVRWWFVVKEVSGAL